MKIKILKAQSQQAQMITELALRSKAHWGYSEQFMQTVAAELTYSSEDLRAHPTYLTLVSDQLVGFYQLVEASYETVELEALFVDPDFMGLGVGAQLFSHAVQTAKAGAYHFITIQSDPYAADFYAKQGCRQVGELASLSIPGRMLPLFKYELD